MRGCRRFVKWLTLAGAAFFLPAAAAGQDLEVSVRATPSALVLADPFEIVLDWQLDLGPSRFLVVESQRLTVDATPVPRRQQKLNATGIVRFRDRVLRSVLLQAYDQDGFLSFQRRFEARSSNGVSLFGVGTIEVQVDKPGAGTLDVDVSPGTATLNVCETGVVVTWTVDAGSNQGLVVRSDKGVFLPSGSLPRVGLPLARRLSGVQTIRERLDVTQDDIRAVSGRTLQYSRDFDFSFQGIGVGSRTEVVELDVVEEDFRIQVSSSHPVVDVGQPSPIALTWRSNARDCQVLTSSGGRFETLAGLPLARQVNGRLRVQGMASARETLDVPAGVVARALELGAERIRYVREFTDQVGTTREGALEFELMNETLSGFVIRRLELRFSGGEAFRLAEQGESLAALAEITYLGTGLLQATWQVADPATAGGAVFRPLEVVRRRLAAGGRIELRSPALPTDLVGAYLVRLEVDEPANSFEPPVLTYQVGRPHVDFVSGLMPRPPSDAPPVSDDDPVVERELVVLSENMKEAHRLEEELGLRTKLRHELNGLKLTASVLRVPRGVSVADLVRQLRERYPTLWVDANHVYEAQSADDRGDDACDLAAAVAKIDWGELQRGCDSGLRIGLVDTEVDYVLAEGHRKSFLPRGEASVPKHGTAAAKLLLGEVGAGTNRFDGLVPKAKDFFFVAEVLHRVKERTSRGIFKDVVNLFRLVLAVNWLLENNVDLINIGVAGRKSLILKFLINELEDRGVFVVASFGKDSRDAYPADYSWVFGTVAVSAQTLPKNALVVPAVLWPERAPCGNSCAAPFVTAAIWVAGADKPPWEILRGRIRETQGKMLRAPDCAAPDGR